MNKNIYYQRVLTTRSESYKSSTYCRFFLCFLLTNFNLYFSESQLAQEQDRANGQQREKERGCCVLRSQHKACVVFSSQSRFLGHSHHQYQWTCPLFLFYPFRPSYSIFLFLHWKWNENGFSPSPDLFAFFTLTTYSRTYIFPLRIFVSAHSAPSLVSSQRNDMLLLPSTPF